MIRKLILICMVATALGQYPRQIAPPLNQRTPVEEYVDYDDYSPRQAPSNSQAPPVRQAMPLRQDPAPVVSRRKTSDILRPATVHYVNIGTELAGDYKFGYDTGKGEDQSFREETRLPDGSVQGAYGYVDETGTQRIVRYIAGKDGFKVLKEGESPETARSAALAKSAAQPTYRPPSQPAHIPQSRQIMTSNTPYSPPTQAQPAYKEPPQLAYRTQPQPQPAYSAPVQPAYRAPVQPAYRAPVQENYYAPQAQQPRGRTQIPKQHYSKQPKEYDDYDYPDNDIAERRLVPVDTTLFNYNIGTSLKTDI